MSKLVHTTHSAVYAIYIYNIEEREVTESGIVSHIHDTQRIDTYCSIL